MRRRSLSLLIGLLLALADAPSVCALPLPAGATTAVTAERRATARALWLWSYLHSTVLESTVLEERIAAESGLLAEARPWIGAGDSLAGIGAAPASLPQSYPPLDMPEGLQSDSSQTASRSPSPPHVWLDLLSQPNLPSDPLSLNWLPTETASECVKVSRSRLFRPPRVQTGQEVFVWVGLFLRGQYERDF